MPISAWVMVLFTLVAGGVAIAGRILSPTLLLDAVALWPLGALAPASGLLAVWKGRGHPRLLALPPLFLLTWLLGAAGLHLGGWDMLPSAVADLRGPAIGNHAATGLDIALTSGSLVVGDGTAISYEVSMVRRGGTTAPPAVGSVVEHELRTVTLVEREAPGWFRFAGWSVTLSSEARWRLTMSAPDIRADLRGLNVESAQIGGGGKVALGTRLGQGTLEVAGTFVVEVPDDVPVRVVGSAIVPGDWTPAGDGWRSPIAGEGWVITVADGASVEIRAR